MYRRRTAWKENSLSTPCRVVFDASSNTGSGFSLIDILVKDRNNMNKLVEIFIKWTNHAAAPYTDVQKMYNTIRLQEEDWCLQRYLWEENLNPSKFPQEKIIKTLIYGTKSSGNQAEYALQKTASASKSEYPEANIVIQRDGYVDDCLSGANTKEEVMQLADEIQIILSGGGFTLNGFTFSGESPTESLSGDNKSINVAGMKWYPEDDKLELDITELNFNKKHRGKKLQSLERNVIPKHLACRHCVSKVAEIYDLVGKITPLTAMMKCDLHELVTRKLDWDDKIPDSQRHVWESYFEMIQNIKGIKFNRAVVPDDAISLDINTIDTGDGSHHLACAAIYARFKRKSGNYSCQLIFSRSKLIPQGMSQPRAELFAATLNAHTGEIVKRSLQTYHKSSVKLTDSQIVLHWLHNENKQLKQWTRNRVIEIHRFADKSLWRYISSTDMIADIGTRRGATLKDISAESVWINGYPWMKLDVKEFPTKTIEEIKLDQQELNAIKTETQIKSIESTDILEESSTYIVHYKLDKEQKKDNLLTVPHPSKSEQIQHCCENNCHY